MTAFIYYLCPDGDLTLTLPPRPSLRRDPSISCPTVTHPPHGNVELIVCKSLLTNNGDLPGCRIISSFFVGHGLRTTAQLDDYVDLEAFITLLEMMHGYQPEEDRYRFEDGRVDVEGLTKLAITAWKFKCWELSRDFATTYFTELHGSTSTASESGLRLRITIFYTWGYYEGFADATKVLIQRTTGLIESIWPLPNIATGMPILCRVNHSLIIKQWR